MNNDNDLNLHSMTKLSGGFATDLNTTTDLNYWIKHPFEFRDPILKPEYL